MALNKYFKIILVFLGILSMRLIPLRPPNVEPILASILPLGKHYGAITASTFAFLSIFFYDLMTAGIGAYTWVSGLSYAFIGLLGAYYMKRASSKGRYIYASIAGVLMFDLITGVLAGPIITGQNFAVALAGQVPFTALHLMGAVIFALLLSPILEKYFRVEEVSVLHFTGKKQVVR